MDCLACEDETLYRLTTNQPSSSACVTAAECEDTAISTSGDRTCSNLRETTVPTVPRVSLIIVLCIDYDSCECVLFVTLFVAGRRG